MTLNKFNFLNNQVILITGGTGSFGAKCVKKILNISKPKKIIIFSRDEQKHYNLKNEIISDRLRFYLGDIRDKQRLNEALRDVDYVIHTAAQKHVDIAEYNPFEAVKTNIIGTQNLIECCLANNVKKVIGLSTDKAVSPINLYGSTKLSAEKLLISANNYKGKKRTIFSVVRYGNVINSKGSVFEYFKKLKQNKIKFLPITDFRMTRFFISLEASINFVLASIKKSQGGEVFIPKMSSIKIIDLAKIIDPKLKLKKIGIRPGEKIHEKLFSSDESFKIYEFQNQFIIYSNDSFDFNKKNKVPKYLKNAKLTKYKEGYSSDIALKKWKRANFLKHHGLTNI